MEPIVHPQSDASLLIVMPLLSKTLRRIPKKRFSFFATAFPMLLMKCSALAKPPPANALHNPDLLQAAEQEKVKSDERFKLFCDAMVEFVRPFAESFQGSTEQQIAKDEQLRREQRWVLMFLFHLLSKLYSSFDLTQQFSKSFPVIMVC